MKDVRTERWKHGTTNVHAYFMDRVSPEPMSGCWLWLGPITVSGYGIAGSTRSPEWYAHRLSHRLFKGDIPAGLHIDHLCRTPLCVNPDHLEAVTVNENSRRQAAALAPVRKTHCFRGHLKDGLRTVGNQIQKYCRQCGSKPARRARKEARA